MCVGEAWLGWQVRHGISIAPSNLLLLYEDSEGPDQTAQTGRDIVCKCLEDTF